MNTLSFIFVLNYSAQMKRYLPSKIVINKIIIFLCYCLGKYDIIYFNVKLSNLHMPYIIPVDLQIILILICSQLHKKYQGIQIFHRQLSDEVMKI